MSTLSDSMSNFGSSLSNLNSTVGSSIGSSLSNLNSTVGSSIGSSSFFNSNSSSNNGSTGNQLTSAENTINDIKTDLVNQSQKLNNLQTTLQSVSTDVSNSQQRKFSEINENDGNNSLIRGDFVNSGNRIINPLIMNSVNNDGLVSPDKLKKENKEIRRRFILKVRELKELFVKYKLNEEDGSYKEAYDKCGYELDAIKKEQSDLSNKIVKVNNILNLRLMSMDDNINKQLRKTSTLRSKIENENNESNSFKQMKEDETIEYRLNLFYIVGILLGSGLLVKNIMSFTKKK